MDLSALRILVVDDNRRALELVRSILTSVGARDIAESTTAHGAFKLLQAQPADLIILDQNLGQGDEGTQLTRRIRNDPGSPTPYAPIIMLTGHSEKRRVTVARDAGVTEFLAKPISAKGLYQRILNVVANPRPFIKTKTYFGPDRRRNTANAYIGPERRVGGEMEVLQQPSLLDKARSNI